MSRCIFCEIVAGRAPASVVFEDDCFLALLDIHPMRPGHTLVIPRRHVVRLDELGVDGLALFGFAARVACAVRAGLPCDDVNLVLNDDVCQLRHEIDADGRGRRGQELGHVSCDQPSRLSARKPRDRAGLEARLRATRTAAATGAGAGTAVGTGPAAGAAAGTAAAAGAAADATLAQAITSLPPGLNYLRR